MNFDLWEKQPSPLFPYPTLQLGYNLTLEQVKEKRKPPCERHYSPPIKKSKCVNLADMNASCEQNMIVSSDSEVSVTVTTEGLHEGHDVPENSCLDEPKTRCKNCDKAARKIK